jgi:chromosome partitioning protein
MSTPVIAFFNNKGGVGKTSLVYHLAWMYADRGMRVVAADLDPQANLTAAFLDEEILEKAWGRNDSPTVYGFIKPLQQGTGDIAEPQLELVNDNLGIILGDLALSGFEDDLSSQWPECLDRKERAFRVISAFWRILQKAAESHRADVILVDLGPNLGAINRAALIASDFVVVPLSPDLFSLQGLKNLGPRLRQWREEWAERLGKNPVSGLVLPSGQMTPAGYIVMQYSVRLDRPTKAYDRWIGQIPQVYRKSVLNQRGTSRETIVEDRHCLALLKHYRSLMPLAQEARKPMFHLKPADGAIGAHMQAVQAAREDFAKLADNILKKTGFPPC